MYHTCDFFFSNFLSTLENSVYPDQQIIIHAVIHSDWIHVYNDFAQLTIDWK